MVIASKPTFVILAYHICLEPDQKLLVSCQRFRQLVGTPRRGETILFSVYFFFSPFKAGTESVISMAMSFP